MSEKLQKVLARAGLGSRRELETWISDGRVSVNGTVATLGDRVGSEDTLRVDGRMIKVKAEEDTVQRVIMYHKPPGEVCSRNDPEGRPTVFDNLPRLQGMRWVQVGRLDSVAIYANLTRRTVTVPFDPASGVTVGAGLLMVRYIDPASNAVLAESTVRLE